MCLAYKRHTDDDNNNLRKSNTKVYIERQKRKEIKLPHCRWSETLIQSNIVFDNEWMWMRCRIRLCILCDIFLCLSHSQGTIDGAENSFYFSFHRLNGFVSVCCKWIELELVNERFCHYPIVHEGFVTHSTSLLSTRFKVTLCQYWWRKIKIKKNTESTRIAVCRLSG